MGEQGYDTAARADVPDRASRHVEQEIQYLRETVLMLRDAVGTIEGRLGGVLRPQDAEPSDKMASLEESLVPIADELRSIRRVAEGANSNALSILDRLEL